MDGGVTGLVLAGGRGSRMGDVDKGLQPFAGVPLAAHAIARLAPQVDALVVSANRHLDRYAAFGHPVVQDASDERAGPLAGIAAGLGACTTAWLLAVPCDVPFFPGDLAARLGAAVGAADAADAAFAATARGPHPAFCLVRATARAALAAHLAGGGRSVLGWLATLAHRRVSFDDEGAFRNLNTIDALRAAERPAR